MLPAFVSAAEFPTNAIMTSDPIRLILCVLVLELRQSDLLPAFEKAPGTQAFRERDSRRKATGCARNSYFDEIRLTAPQKRKFGAVVQQFFRSNYEILTYSLIC